MDAIFNKQDRIHDDHLLSGYEPRNTMRQKYRRAPKLAWLAYHDDYDWTAPASAAPLSGTEDNNCRMRRYRLSNADREPCELCQAMTPQLYHAGTVRMMVLLTHRIARWRAQTRELPRLRQCFSLRLEAEEQGFRRTAVHTAVRIT